MLFKCRKRPARGVLIHESIPTVIYTTVCAYNRRRWLANPQVHAAIRAAWLRHMSWVVTAYVLMPDHVHFFAQPGGGKKWLPFDDWVSVWKRGMARVLKNREYRWQRPLSTTGSVATRMLLTKEIYMDENPVRGGLVKQVADWPYRGELVKRDLWWP